MLNGLSLFSGIGGIDVALSGYVRPIAYCEIDKYGQVVLFSRMSTGDIAVAPIWDDVTTLDGTQLSGQVDIIYGGFPCQDISVAGRGAGLAGQRSGLFFEIVRLAKEIKPAYIFLENVPAITKRGGIQVVGCLAQMGYDCRWCCISAASVGALHRRERWFLLANAKSEQDRGIFTRRFQPDIGTKCADVAHAMPSRLSFGSTNQSQNESIEYMRGISPPNICDTMRQPSEQADQGAIADAPERDARGRHPRQYWPTGTVEHWQETVSAMGKCSDGVSDRVARLRALGNAVVPIQVETAFKMLMGYNG